MKSDSGFSKLSKRKKLRWVVENFFRNPEEVMRELTGFWHHSEEKQKIFDEFSENTLTNFYLPFGIAPNFVINGTTYCVPMVIEESSVVAAASAGAKFWMDRGGFKATVTDVTKVGQVHFLWHGKKSKLESVFPDLRSRLLEEAKHITANMDKRGGGILQVELVDKKEIESGYYQLDCTFNTCDAMGANFINSVLEQFAKTLKGFVATHAIFDDSEREVTIVMAILSNYTPECLVKAWAECPIEALGKVVEDDPETFAKKFELAVRIAHHDIARATTHNKGIFNGIDAVVMATGNDFRAVEGCGHTFAARSGQYRSLTSASIEDGMFRFSIEFPIAVGTVGGLTNLHPLAKRSLELLGNPNAKELMQIIVCVGLAQNFAAVKSLVTTGIQFGHMKMHLMNILIHMNATKEEIQLAVEHFNEKTISFTAVREFLDALRAENLIQNTKSA